MDLHPVSTILAKTTYLLAIGPDRLNEERDSISIPVYLGDSMQWQINEGLLIASGSGITVDVDDGWFIPRAIGISRICDDKSHEIRCINSGFTIARYK